MFKKILIANRSEIACRIIETCRRLGIQSVAVYSEVEANARHVQMADEAHCIGAAAPGESYLRMETILSVAQQNQVEAIHPGYGFLAENVEFALQCQEKGIVFIGPSPEAIEVMGSKSRAKQLMEEVGIPVVPGYHGTEQDPAFLQAEAQKIGYPLMIKAVAGGGGKGMRLVKNSADFLSLLESAKRETRNAFGDENMLLERFVATPRHIEFQIFGDEQGNVVHLFERECSIQRRHQKIIEETPSPFLSKNLRFQMGTAAITAAKAIDYVGAGTIEFLVGADHSFYFMEMNTRLQVEHAITEMTTGFDLVEWQLRVANHETLPVQQDHIRQEGHAIEVRIYAENPNNQFLPSIGKLHQWVHPEVGSRLRVDTGINQGDVVQIHYDPMLAKLIVWDENRANAIQRLQNALAQTGVMGVTTNIPFLHAIASHPSFLEGSIDTLFVDTHLEELLPTPSEPPELVVWAAAIQTLLRRESQIKQAALESGDAHSPWNRTDHWRMNGQGYENLEFRNRDDQTFSVQIHKEQECYIITLPQRSVSLAVKAARPPFLTLQYEGKQETLMILQQERNCTVVVGQERYDLSEADPFFIETETTEITGQIKAPMPGLVGRLLVAQGDSVKSGQTLMILEAMKMEHSLQASRDGIVEKIYHAEGAVVDEGTILITITE